MSGAVDSRERLARLIFCNVSGVREEYPSIVRAVIWEAAYQKIASGQTMLGDWPHEAADAILSSDWLRDTLAAERRAGFIAGRDAAASYMDGMAKYWGHERTKWRGGSVSEVEARLKAMRYQEEAQDIRNLEPEATGGR